jgi:hypothetical protein
LLIERLITANSESALDQEHEQHNYPVFIEEERELAYPLNQYFLKQVSGLITFIFSHI